jgi:hypothetical protein
VDDIPEEHAGYYQAFKLWRSKEKPKLIDAESRVYHRQLRYAGTADLPCIIGGEAVCVDFKTTTQIAEMLVRVQLEAYSKAYESHGFKFGSKAVVLLNRDGTYDMKLYKAGDSEAWSVFGSLLEIHNYINKYKVK